MNSSEKAYNRDVFLREFVGCKCGDQEDIQLSEYEKSISEINAMIQYNIDIGNQEEIAYWRKMLQRTRVEKRRAKARMIESKRMEFALT